MKSRSGRETGQCDEILIDIEGGNKRAERTPKQESKTQLFQQNQLFDSAEKPPYSRTKVLTW
jgi:hypothetical protein